PAAVGQPIFLAGVAGTIALLMTRLRESAVVLAFPIAYYLVAGRGYAVFARYILPVVPFLCITAAWLAVAGVRTTTRRAAAATQKTIVAIVALAMVWPTARNAVLLDRLLATTDNRIVVARALGGLVAPDSFVCQSGETYGHVPLGIDGRPAGRPCGRDAGGRF